MSAEPARDAQRRSLVSRLRDRNGSDDSRPHLVVCGGDALVYTLAEELSNAGHRVRLTVVVPPRLRADVPDLTALRGVRVIRAERLDEATFVAAGLTGADALALVMSDDVVNLHAALCAQAIEPNLRLVIRMLNSALGHGVRKLFASCAVLSDAAMAAPAFVAAALGEVAPTHFRHAGRSPRPTAPARSTYCPPSRNRASPGPPTSCWPRPPAARWGRPWPRRRSSAAAGAGARSPCWAGRSGPR